MNNFTLLVISCLIAAGLGFTTGCLIGKTIVDIYNWYQNLSKNKKS